VVHFALDTYKHKQKRKKLLAKQVELGIQNRSSLLLI
jgi:hypothetical protein